MYDGQLKTTGIKTDAAEPELSSFLFHVVHDAAFHLPQMSEVRDRNGITRQDAVSSTSSSQVSRCKQYHLIVNKNTTCPQKEVGQCCVYNYFNETQIRQKY